MSISGYDNASAIPCRIPSSAAKLGILFLLTSCSFLASAQTLTVLHTFTGENTADGAHPMHGVVLDRAGNVYGVTCSGGVNGQPSDICFTINDNGGCGIAFKLTRQGSGWLYSLLYKFQGPPDGNFPAGIVVGPDGSLFGATQGGGIVNNGPCDQYVNGCGTVFRLRPPATFCPSALCPWNETLLHSFTAADGDGGNPGNGDLIFDRAQNIYGTTNVGGTAGLGSVYEMAYSQGSWTESTVYSFNSPSQGMSSPVSGLIMDSAGNFYGTTDPVNTTPNGAIYQLVPAQSGWTANVLQSFVCVGGLNGCFPQALIFDSAGNLIDATGQAGHNGKGTVIKLLASDNWSIDLLYTFANNQGGVSSRLTMDAAGNLYGTAAFCGNGDGCVFKLTPSGGGYVYSELYDFTETGGGVGHNPMGPVAIDANGNLYGTTYSGGNLDRCLGEGDSGCGTVWELTP